MPRGFFTSTKIEKASPVRRVSGAKIPKSSSVVGCFACGLDKTCITPKMPAGGEGRRGLLVIAEAPGRVEDERGTQLVGESGQLLQQVLALSDIDLHKDCRKINSLSCRPPDNRTPSNKEIDYCRPNVWKEIREFKPKVILLLGSVALESFLGHRYPEATGGIGKWRGFVIPDRETQAWVIPTVHPAYVLRSEKQPAVKLTFRNDVMLAVKMLDVPFPHFVDEKTLVEMLTGEKLEEKLNQILQDSRKQDLLLAFDYETSGIKPHAEGHFICCMAMSWSDGHSISFMMPDKGSVAMSLIKRILQSSRIKKTAHNMKFEDIWTRHILGVQVKGWYLCTMLGAHVLDNRSGICGLKFQTYINFGVIDYASHLQSYLKARGEGDNSLNRVNDAPVNELLLYCGLDALFQYRLARIQEKTLRWRKNDS